MKVLQEIKQKHLDKFLTYHNPLEEADDTQPRLKYAINSEIVIAAINAGILLDAKNGELTPAQVFEFADKVYEVVIPALLPPEKK